MTQIKDKLDSVLAAKNDIDQKAQDLASQKQDDPLVYRELIQDPSWDKM
jgi:peptidoglycan hydrolase CwlO-like protein